jgi:NitT/TauT family transport system permease protein
MAQVAELSEIAAQPAGETGPVWRALRNIFPFIVTGGAWETAAHLGLFPAKFFPPLETVAATFMRLTISGVLPHHVLDTLLRLIAGFALAAIVGVGIVSTFPIIYNAWTGVKAVKDIWVRAAHAMGADDRRLFRHVILPGALPYVLTGLRLGLAQAWRILVAVEMLAAVPWGLGWMIFGAQEFLNTDVMLSGIAVIALIGVGLEKLVFQPLENFTVVRWGMVTS